MTERCLKVFLTDEGKMRVEGDKFTIGEVEEIGKGLIGMVKNIQIGFNTESGTATEPAGETIPKPKQDIKETR